METAVKTITMRVFEAVSDTAVNCERDGHCWHQGTAVGSRYCCKCGMYDYSQRPIIPAISRGFQCI